MTRALLIIACLSLVAPAAVAQGAKAPAVEKPAAEPPPPYEAQLLRLSEILGALAYLEELCGSARDGAEVREQMAALIEAEAASPARKARFAGAYNKGFRGFEQIYASCTPNAGVLIARFLVEGQQIARDVANRFGGG